MNETLVRRGPGRKKGSYDYRPTVIKLAERRQAVVRMYDCLERAQESGDEKDIRRFYMWAKAVEITLKASPKSIETTGATNFVLSISGLRRPELQRGIIEHSPVALSEGVDDGEG